MSEYNITDAYVPVTGGWNPFESMSTWAQTTIVNHALLVSAVLLVLVVVLIWLLFWKKEGFNPTQNLRDQDSDQFGLGARERMESGRGASVFAQQVQTPGGGQLVFDPRAAANQPGSLAWNVLHSADFDCGKRKQAPEDAWEWMNGVAHESMQGAKPKTDNDFSRVLAGH